ncbi:DUF2357 domain-containing protein [Thermococcus sp. 101 C5]|jgi:hypothetical protein|uniref:DUF2357 domain-containing protein n=1 Tax=Thermococcus TaxID=2263 RepID=UPI000AD91D14|nr:MULTISPECIES: DUF2357 domain-containing protein [Thermococcus]MCA6214508.1 DUF2357 domain-containing protein [Thermococcus bergensis]MPW39554.1 DUF2357 domain-containing protein [Thermococcus sp. 101 C5]HIH72315.1 DUF2357 domain-containing protein [Thermococcaceae archaeon]
MEENKNEVLLDREEKYRLQAILKNKKEKECMIEDNGTLYLFEWQEYRIIGEKAFTLRIGNENLDAEKIDDNTYIATFQFKNYIGKTNIEILEGIKPISLKFENFEVLSEKVEKIYKDREDIVGKHRRLYKALVEYITEKSISLPFSISAPTAFEVEESEEPISELFAYHFLINNKGRIISAYEEITRRPHRKLFEREDWLDFWEVSEVGEDTLISIITHPKYLVKAEASSIAIARYLNNHVPTRVIQKVKYESFDTHENRFAKRFLNDLITWNERVINSLLTSSSLTAEQRENIISKLSFVLGELEYYATRDIFDDVGEMVIFPYTSQVLLKREGYRDLLQLWQEFRSYSPFFGEMQKAIDNKDIAKLYEYWCFFKLVEELESILGWKGLRLVIEPTGELHESDSKEEVYAEFNNGWRIYYNKKLTPKKWSYSVSLRPDFSLFARDPSEQKMSLLGVFDAKFKFDVVDINKFADEDKGMEREPTLQRWAKLEDIYKMHTYKDALNAKFAVVLYPGNKSVFFGTNKRCIGDLERCEGKFDLDRLLDKNGVKLEGIGYLSMIPEVKG